MGLKHLKALDFCSASSACFVDTFISFLSDFPPWTSRIKHLGLHNCSTLLTSFFDAFLPRFTNLERLDLYNTQVSGRTLLNIHPECRLQVLNLSQCTRISATSLVSFVESHPASQQLKVLNLFFSVNKVHPLSTTPQALDAFIQALPRDIQVLDMSGIDLDLEHFAYMPPDLVELGARDISFNDRQYTNEPDQPQQPLLKQLKYLSLTLTSISSEPKFSAMLWSAFPNLFILESPGFKRLTFLCSMRFEKLSTIGRREWIRCRGEQRVVNECLIEQCAGQYHPRKSNMSLTSGTPRGIYDYYSYRF